VWIARSYILSGYPLFPSSVGGWPFDWAMPPGGVRNTANVVYTSARFGSVQGLYPWSRFLWNWDWLGAWVNSLFDNEVAWGSEIVLYLNFRS
jgi:hypothetical protein